MREQFSGALGRFVINPDLGSEEAWLGESSLRYAQKRLTLEATGFVTFTSKTIDQIVVVVNGSTKRMRVNLNGSRNIGIELNGGFRPSAWVGISADATICRLRAEDPSTGNYDRPLTERPENTGAFRFTYTHTSGASATLEAVYSGPAFSSGEDGTLVELSSSTVLNGRASYRVSVSRWRPLSFELFVRLNNVGDVVVENQLRLPGPGRTMIAGIKLSL